MTMCEDFADSAVKSSKRINTAVQSSVQDGAPLYFVGVKSIKPVGAEPVYNMEVSDTHCFSVNGGVIVHNCMDDIRYFCYTLLRREFFREMGDYRHVTD